jgi:hypothetical protein
MIFLPNNWERYQLCRKFVREGLSPEEAKRLAQLQEETRLALDAAYPPCIQDRPLIKALKDKHHVS